MAKCPACRKEVGYAALGGLCPSCYDAGIAVPKKDRAREKREKSPQGRLLKFVDSNSRVLLALIGLGAAFVGYQEYSVSAGLSDTPTEIDLTTFEAGDRPAKGHIRVGKHFRLYDSSVYKFNRRDKDLPLDRVNVDFTLYPIISSSSPYFEEMRDLKDDEPLPPCNDFAVLVMTKRYRTASQIPLRWEESESVEGLIVTKVADLPIGTERLIRDEFRGLDLNSLVILEEGRKPASTTFWLVTMLAGVACILVAVGSAIADRKFKINSSS